MFDHFTCLFLLSADFFFKIHFSKSFSGIPSDCDAVSNSLDPGQAQHFVGPDLGPNW